MGSNRLLLVHGAFHGAWCWDRLIPELSALGIVADAVDLPFTSPEDDVAVVRRAIDDMGGEVVVLGHSFGGAVISAAAIHQGARYGAVTSLIYLTAFMTAPDQVIDFSGAPGIAEVELGDVTASVDPAVASSIFYNTCSEDDAAWAAAQLRSMPTSVLIAPPPVPPAWEVTPSAYIVCTEDRILSVKAQEQMATNADAVFRIESDHSPFLSCPVALAQTLQQILSPER